MRLLLPCLLLLASNAPAQITVWAAGCTEKIQPDRRSELPHDGPWDEQNRTVTLVGVRGEHVPFQVVITADHVEVEDVTVEVRPFTGGGASLPERCVQVFLQHPVKVYAATGEHGRSGDWPDALVPLTRPFAIRSALRHRGPILRHQPLWIDLKVPADQPAGDYVGEVVVKVAGEPLDPVRVHLELLDAHLPDERRTTAQMGFFYGRDIARVHEVEQGSDAYRQLWLRYLAYLLEFRCDPTFIDLGVRGGVVDGQYRTEFADPELESFLVEHGLRRFAIGAVPPGVSQADVEPAQFEAWVEQYLTQVIAHARAAGWYDRLVFLAPVDEPQSAEEYARAREWGARVHAVDSKVPMAVTEQPVPEDESWGSLVGACNDWIVHGSFLDSNAAAISERQAAGETVTWYISCDQLYPQANYYIDRAAADPRLIGWITWRYQLGGILYWATTLWREVRDPWMDAIHWKKSHCNAPAAGEGMLLYPGNLIERYTGQANVDGPIASLRLALLREGLEELELLQALADAGQRELANELARSLVRDVRDLTRDPNAIDRAHEALLRALAR